MTGRPAANPEDRPGKGKRPGSRPLLAVALLAAVLAAFSAGTLVPEALARLLDIDSNAIRLALKVTGAIAALPAMFYLAERIFLDRARRGK